MEWLARGLSRKSTAWLCIGIVAACAVGFTFLAGEVGEDDDILAFLPVGNEDVALFTAINKRFGGLDVAIVGIEVDDPFDPDFLSTLKDTTRALNDLESVEYALSLTNLEDFTPDPEGGGIVLSNLVDRLPDSPQAKEALRAKVMSKDHVVGNLISADATALNIYCFSGYGTDPKTVAGAVRQVVQERMPDMPIYWGGAPFIATYIFETTQEDMARLTPYAVIAIVLLMLLAFRDVVGSALALVATGMGIVVSHGMMGLLGVDFNIVLGSMPVILFAVGSAYSIHILSHYYVLEPIHGRDEAIRRTLVGVGPTVLAAGLTTVAGLLSFVMMDITPMRTFGIFTAVGIFATLILALTFVPAVIRVTGLRRKAPPTGQFATLVARLSVWAARHRLVLCLAFASLCFPAFVWMTQVDTRMDNAAFLNPGSPPDQAERFMGEHFGGSQFVQILVRGDFKEPEALREIQAYADDLAKLDQVTDVLQVAMAVAQANGAMEGAIRIPDTREKVALLYGFMQGNRSLGQLITDERDEALLTLKVSATRADEVERVLMAVEAYAAAHIPDFWILAPTDGPRGEEARARRQERVAARVQDILRRRGLQLTAAQQQGLSTILTTLTGGQGPRASQEDVKPHVATFLRSDECIADLPEGDPTLPDRVASEVVTLGHSPDEDTFIAAIARATGGTPEDELVDDLAFALETPLRELWDAAQGETTARHLLASLSVSLPEGTEGERMVDGLAHAVLALRVSEVLLSEDSPSPHGSFDVRVNGLPVLHRGLSESVRANQIKSLGFALGLVLIIMTILFRSLWSGLLATSPMLMTLLFIYGGMGLLGVRLDIGTSMLASIIIGAGVDYAVHLVAAWRAPAPGDLPGAARAAATATGSAIWTNALMVAAGFYVLTLGEARPLQNVGGLTSAAMITAALVTFLAIPMLARKDRYSRNQNIGALTASDTQA